MSNKEARHNWIANYIKTKSPIGVDVLNAEFVAKYIDEFNAKFKYTMYGAFKCPQLGRDLSEMHKAGLLDRTSMGIGNVGVDGMPKWIYVYTSNY